jgi:hypothetical protein
MWQMAFWNGLGAELVSTGQQLLPLPAVFSDVHDLVFEDEEIWLIFARESHHVPVVIFNPAAHYFTVGQLDDDRLLLFTQRLQVARFL